MHVTMTEAKDNLEQLGEQAQEGGEVVICRAGKPWLRLVPMPPTPFGRRLGGLEGQIEILPGFGDRDDDLTQAIEDSRIFPEVESEEARRGGGGGRPIAPATDAERERCSQAMDRFQRYLARQRPIGATLPEMLAARREGLL